MSQEFEVELKGVDELKRALEQVPDKLKKKGLLKGLRLAGNLVHDAARRSAPVLQTKTPYRNKGTVRKNIVVRTSKYARKAGDLGVFVGVRPLRGVRTKKLGAAGARNPNDPFYWWFLEFGTKQMSKRPFLADGAKELDQAADIVIREATSAINQINTGAA
jgi:HK97 gp10 family phage protein